VKRILHWTRRHLPYSYILCTYETLPIPDL